ncbi:MAG: hypothetical protein ABL933_04320 [Methyloglobulus sp.]|nr:hypothetical protein [Methyloglobulus sp.]
MAQAKGLDKQQGSKVARMKCNGIRVIEATNAQILQAPFKLLARHPSYRARPVESHRDVLILS